MWLYILAGLPLFLWIYKEVTMGVCRNRNSMAGKTVVITGGSDGIGLETAIDLVKRGARLIIGCRRTQQATDRIFAAVPEAEVGAIPLDLSCKDSVLDFCSQVRQYCSKIDVLINNAGIAGSTSEQKKKVYDSDKRHEKVMAINFWGHVVLNNELLDLVKAGAGDAKEDYSRIILVSSMAMFNGDLHKVTNGQFNLDNMKDQVQNWENYNNSKQAQWLYGKKLAQNLSQEGANVSVTVLHPGLVRTSIFDGFDTKEKLLINVMCYLLGKSSGQGAQTSIYLATEDLPKEHIHGKFFSDCRPWETQIYNFIRPIKKFAPDNLLDPFWEYTQANL